MLTTYFTNSNSNKEAGLTNLFKYDGNVWGTQAWRHLLLLLLLLLILPFNFLFSSCWTRRERDYYMFSRNSFKGYRHNYKGFLLVSRLLLTLIPESMTELQEFWHTPMHAHVCKSGWLCSYVCMCASALWTWEKLLTSMELLQVPSTPLSPCLTW